MHRLQILRAANVRPDSIDLHALLAVALDSGPGECELAVSAILKNGKATEKDLPALMRIASRSFLPEDIGAQMLASLGGKAVAGLSKAVLDSDERTVTVSARALAAIGRTASPALDNLRQAQFQHKRTGMMSILGQTRTCTVIGDAINAIASGQPSGSRVPQNAQFAGQKAFAGRA